MHPQLPQVQTVESRYDFIVNPKQPAKHLPLPVGSLRSRLMVAAGGLLVVLILFVVIKGLFGGSAGGTATIIAVTQRQQEIIRLTTAASNKTDISSDNKNFALTTALSISSAQSQLVSYLGTQGIKVAPKTLALKMSTATDQQLEAAEAATTYDSTFQQVMKTQFNLYEQDLQHSYQQTTGQKGRAILKTEYDGAALLLKKLNQT
ncbi:MAG: hypothetical protein JWN38_650 [Candidatus Saccharibacteria bacterium]|nr:hypothetical protein [Candidatus Saccharibacteria bacterium]